MYQGYSEGQKAAARTVIERAINAGLNVTAYNGAVEALEHSTDIKALFEFLGETGEDELTYYNAEGKRLGFAFLVWGNCPSGYELVSNYGWTSDVNETLIETLTNLDHLDPDK
jgi:hypothetical protein